ncbi:MAG: aspartate-semialdehyde dehydrogenase [Pseudoramibacter sp.]
MKKYNVAVVGATGLVGQMMCRVLEERKFPVDHFYPMASSRSAGKEIDFAGKKYVVEETTPESFDKDIDLAIFSAGAGTSRKFAPEAAKRGVIVVDNSSCWRMDPDVPLVVPEVNPEDLKWHHNIIANPNCSTIQAMLPLKAIYDKYGIERIVYSTYQAVSGAGVQGFRDLKDGVNGVPPKKFPYPIAFNILPHIDDFLENGYTKEEMKMVNETHKILHDDSIRITATTARVPVFYGHSESINVELKKPFETVKELQDCMANFKNVILRDDPEHNIYPMPIEAEGHDEVYVGRIRRDFSIENGFNFWCVGDNIRKGAASNAIQIAESLVEQDLVHSQYQG